MIKGSRLWGPLIRSNNNNYSNQGSVVSPPKFQFRMRDKRYPGIVESIRANSSDLCLLIIRANTWRYNAITIVTIILLEPSFTIDRFKRD